MLLRKREEYAVCMFAPSTAIAAITPGYPSTELPSDCDRTHNTVQLGCSILWVVAQRILIFLTDVSGQPIGSVSRVKQYNNPHSWTT